ncbi:MAG: universal stress protein [Rhodobacteraceae bacterium]|nr:universal stress protein [Paracoccaceae bacterium]
MYSHLLVTVAYDKGHDAGPVLEIARALAAPGAKITLIHVMEPAPVFALDYLPEGWHDDMRAAITADLEALTADQPGAEVMVTEGDAAAEILEAARAGQADCIVIASHRPGTQGLHLGSTATKVVGRAQCAVHVARRA